MQNAPVLEAISRRRSIREFTAETVAVDQLLEIIKAGIWAPSGLNNQPWRFRIVNDIGLKDTLAAQTTYGHIIKAANALIAVYLDTSAMYDPIKDHQSAGACIQNMLLAIEALHLGGVWLGQILKNKNEVNRILGIDARYDLMAVIAVGHPEHHNQRSTRKAIDHFLI